MCKSTGRLLFVSIIAVALFLQACNPDDEPDPVEENELITTLRLTLKIAGTDSSLVLSFTDLDGDGGADPVIVGATLNDSTVYTASLQLLDESVSPATDITAEILEEAEEHQFFFAGSGLSLITTYTDIDINGRPLGLQFQLTTREAGNGNFRITLRHQPDKNATGVADGDIANAGGETDIEVSLPVIVE